MGEPKTVGFPVPHTNGNVKIRKTREVKPQTFGKLLGETIDKLDGMSTDQRIKLLGAITMHYGDATKRGE